jgi:two-component system invasion response regulator UvrY
MVRIIIADDHPVFREGLRKILSKEVDLEIVFEAESGEELLGEIDNLEFDLIILDVGLPGRSGIDILADIRKTHPKIPVLIFSMHPEERFALRAIKAGANAYLSKEEKAEKLIEAIHTIKTGRKYITPTIAEKLANTIDKNIEKAPHENLSTREFEVMRMIAIGKSVREIAEDLSISVNTVNTYRMRVLDKMDFNSNMDLAYYVIQNKLID